MPKAYPTFLALHGFTGGGEDFVPFTRLFGGKWHCPDLPGHGAHPKEDCSPQGTFAFLRAKLIKLSPPPSVLLGYSMGARAALQLALGHPWPWDAVILISGTPGISNEAERLERRRADACLAQRVETLGVAEFIDYWQSTPIIRSQQRISAKWRQSMQESRNKHTAQGLARSLRQFGQGNCPNLWPELGALRAPLLMITGADDQKYQKIASRAMDLITTQNPKAKAGHIVLPNAGHAPHLETPQATKEVILSFLERLRH